MPFGRRYGGDFEAMINFIEKSVKWRRRFAPLMLPVFGFTALILTAIFIYGLTALTFRVPDSWPWPFDLGLLSATIATTCAFGLWRYTGLELGRAALASVTICVLVYAGGGGPHCSIDLAQFYRVGGHNFVVGHLACPLHILRNGYF